MIAFVATLHSNIVDLAIYGFAYMLVKDCVNGTLICWAHILQTEGHHCVTVDSQWCSDGWMPLILWIHLDLIISWEAVHEGHSSNPHVLSILTSVNNSLLGQATFRSRKSMQIRIFPFFLGTGIMLATQSRCYSFLMKPESMTFLTFDLIASIISGRNRRCCCLTSLASGLMLRWCIAIWESSLGMSL